MTPGLYERERDEFSNRLQRSEFETDDAVRRLDDAVKAIIQTARTGETGDGRVFVLPVGAQALKDLAVEKIAVDDFAFVRNQVTVDVIVTARGFGSTEVPVVLRREGQVVAQKTIHIDGSRSRYEVKLTFVPDRTGKFAFTVTVPVYDGEAIAHNNSRSFVLKVIRDRVRVVLVVGRPSWDVRFLRQLLKRDPNVDLISFFILRTPGDDTRSSQDELSLIPFPTQEIFQEQLKTFDLVIFQDFGNRPWYHLSQYLDGIASYVRDGGRFSEVFCLSNDYEQSVGRVFEAARRIVEASPLLASSARCKACRHICRAKSCFRLF